MSLTAAMFVFQACYGTMGAMEPIDTDEIVDSLDESMVESEQAEASDIVLTKAGDVE